jgi:hypothetical protein
MYYNDLQAGSQLALFHLKEKHESLGRHHSDPTSTKQASELLQSVRWLVRQLGHQLVILGEQLEGFGLPQPTV